MCNPKSAIVASVVVLLKRHIQGWRGRMIFNSKAEVINDGVGESFLLPVFAPPCFNQLETSPQPNTRIRTSNKLANLFYSSQARN